MLSLQLSWWKVQLHTDLLLNLTTRLWESWLSHVDVRKAHRVWLYRGCTESALQGLASGWHSLDLWMLCTEFGNGHRKNYSLSSASMGFKSLDQSSSLAFDGRYLERKTVPAVNTSTCCFCHSWFFRKHRIRTIQAALPHHRVLGIAKCTREIWGLCKHHRLSYRVLEYGFWYPRGVLTGESTLASQK